MVSISSNKCADGESRRIAFSLRHLFRPGLTGIAEFEDRLDLLFVVFDEIQRALEGSIAVGGGIRSIPVVISAKLDPRKEQR